MASGYESCDSEASDSSFLDSIDVSNNFIECSLLLYQMGIGLGSYLQEKGNHILGQGTNLDASIAHTLRSNLLIDNGIK